MNKNELMKNMSQAYLLLSEKRKEEFFIQRWVYVLLQLASHYI